LFKKKVAPESKTRILGLSLAAHGVLQMMMQK
jgi:hypothetical protein